MHSLNPNADRDLATTRPRPNDTWLWIACSPGDAPWPGDHYAVASIPTEGQHAGPFERILWRVSTLPPGATELRRIRNRLTERGCIQLILEGAPGPGSALNQILRELSEAGFVILRKEILSPEPESASGCGGIRFGSTHVEARRDRFQVRGYREGDEEAILKLFTPSFHVARSLEHWRWKYLDQPFGRLRLSMAFSPEGELAAHHGAYPVPFRRADGKRGMGLQIGDLMTDPRFRRVGLGHRSLLARCAEHAYAAFGRGRVDFNYGFNTATSLTFSLRFMGASKVQPVESWTRSASIDPGRGRYRVEVTDTLHGGFDRFFRRAAPAYGFLVERGSTYLRWRYLERPDVNYLFLSAYRWRKLVGWGVFRQEGERLIWGDALFAPRHAEAAAQTLISTAVRSHPEALSLEAWFSTRPAWWKDTLLNLGFSRREEPNGLWMTCVPHDDAQAPEHLRQLYYTMGDGDLF